MFFCIQILRTSGTPLGSEFWLRKQSEPQTEGKYWNQYVFGIQIRSISGTPLGSNFWLRKGSGAQTGGKSWNLYVFSFQILSISGTPLGSDFSLEKAPVPIRTALRKRQRGIEPERWFGGKACFRRRAKSMGPE